MYLFLKDSTLVMGPLLFSFDSCLWANESSSELHLPELLIDNHIFKQMIMIVIIIIVIEPIFLSS